MYGPPPRASHTEQQTCEPAAARVGTPSPVPSGPRGVWPHSLSLLGLQSQLVGGIGQWREGAPSQAHAPSRLSSKKTRGEFSERLGHCPAPRGGTPCSRPGFCWRVSPGCLRADPWVVVPCRPRALASSWEPGCGSGRPIPGTWAGCCFLFSSASPAAASALALTLVARC